jgi:hypothetical protein
MERKATLAVRDDECVWITSTVANGVEAPGLFSVLTAELDRHTFRMPVIFMAGLSVDIWGRVGLMDQFDITLDSTAMTTTVTWSGATTPPWAEAWETDWADKLAELKPPSPSP